MDTSLREVHAEGHLRRTLSTLKMLLRGHLPKEEFILTDRKMPSARFFLLGKGKICWEIGRFCVVCGRKPLRVGALCGAVVPRGGQGATPTPHFALTLPLYHLLIIQFVLDLSEKHPERRIMWSFGNWWTTGGMNISCTTSGDGCWSGCCWCGVRREFLRLVRPGTYGTNLVQTGHLPP